MAVAATIGGAISMLAQYLQFGALFGGNRENSSGIGWIGALVAMIVAPMAAMMVQMAVSRSREYQADRLGGMICGNPMWLASALRKIEHYARGIRNEPAEAAPATAHLFIINPLTGEGMDNLFSTHPNTAEPHCGAGEAGSGARAWRIAPAAAVELLSSRRIGTVGRRCVRQAARTVGMTRSQHGASGGSAQRNAGAQERCGRDRRRAIWRTGWLPAC